MSDQDIAALEGAAAERPGSAEAQAELGFAYADAGRDEQALTAFERAVAMAPGDTDLLLAAADAAHRLGRIERVAELCDRALDVAPHRPEVYAGAARLLDTGTHAVERLLAAAQFLRMAPSAPERGTYRTIVDTVLDKLIGDARRVAGAEPSEAGVAGLEAYLRAATSLEGVIEPERLATVRETIEAALEHQRPPAVVRRAAEAPTDLPGHLAAAEAALESGDASGAARRFRSASLLAETDEERASALAGESRARLAAGDAAAALSAANEAVALDGNNGQVRRAHAEAAAALGDWDRALASYQLAEADDPFDAEIQRGLGVALAALGRWDEARDPLQKALAADAEDIELCRLLGDCFRELGLARLASECYEEALRLEPTQADAARLRDYLASVAERISTPEPAEPAPAPPAARTYGLDDDDDEDARHELQASVRDRVVKRREQASVQAEGSVRCPVCRTANDASARTCARCGAALGLQEEVQPSGKSKCFVATASCGAGSLEVARLQAYRECILRQTPAGRAMIAGYERLSPPLAAWLEGRPAACARVRRWIIAPLADRAARRLARDLGDGC